jgi:bile acid:Na+ symporter, BASS family
MHLFPIERFLHRHFLALLIVAYALAAWLPAFGEAIRHLSLLRFRSFEIAMPMALLAVLLFNAGMSIEAAEVVRTLRRPFELLLGAAANILVPLGVVLFLLRLLGWWHDTSEVESLIVGFSVIAATPIAGSPRRQSNRRIGRALGLHRGLCSIFPLTAGGTRPLMEYITG